RRADPLARRDEPRKRIASATAIDRLRGELHSLAHVSRDTGHVAPGPGVEQDRDARPVLGAVQDAARHRRVLRGVAADDLRAARGRGAQLAWLAPALTPDVATHLPRTRRAARADLVEAVLAVNDARVPDAELGEIGRASGR